MEKSMEKLPVQSDPHTPPQPPTRLRQSQSQSKMGPFKTPLIELQLASQSQSSIQSHFPFRSQSTSTFPSQSKSLTPTPTPTATPTATSTSTQQQGQSASLSQLHNQSQALSQLLPKMAARLHAPPQLQSKSQSQTQVQTPSLSSSPTHSHGYAHSPTHSQSSIQSKLYSSQSHPKSHPSQSSPQWHSHSHSSSQSQSPSQPQSQSPAYLSVRRPSNAQRESLALPTPPPDPRRSLNTNDIIFKYPPDKKDLPVEFHSLLDADERKKEFYKTLGKTIADDCKRLHQPLLDNAEGGKSAVDIVEESTTCASCQRLTDDCERLIDPMQQRCHSSIAAALASYGAIEQLRRLYSLWDQYCCIERKLQQRKECCRYVNLLQDKMNKIKKDVPSDTQPTPSQSTNNNYFSDTEADLEHSIALLDTILAEEQSASSSKRGSWKLYAQGRQRERSKSVMVDDMPSFSRDRESLLSLKQTGNNRPTHLVRRQSTYSDGKSKVSKWTKVKAAFKWERANVVPLTDGHKEVTNGIGLTPVNHEVARYLRVPSVPCGGGSSADSILSSSSGHFLSEIGTPGTISSASSMDDIDNSSGRSAIRRGSTKSDNKVEEHTTALDVDHHTNAPIIITPSDAETIKPQPQPQPQPSPTVVVDTNKNSPVGLFSRSSSNKSIRKCKVMPEFEALPEDNVADLKTTITKRKTKPPPSPLDLNLKQDLGDLEFCYSPYTFKSPKEGTQSLHRMKKISSPGNSSVPSSPSRHSDFFPELESEDISSGDISEPTTPNHLSARSSYQQKQDEINQRYQILRTKLGMEFETKRREWEKIKADPKKCLAITLIHPKIEEQSVQPVYNVQVLEENLTPDFKKKLRKWRVKKQISITGGGQHGPPTMPASLQPQQPQQQLQAQPQPAHQGPPISPNKDMQPATIHCDAKSKIDWNLWKTGQLKFEGQGLQPLPDQKDLPEDFQKKLEQWNKIKRGGGNDSIKRSGKHSDSGGKKSSDDDRDKRTEKHKPHEKDKSEKLAKLKAIVADHPAKKIEVKTSAGVMMFEGISRKFTRKLYEWEKARGIGPESSTIALLHAGYCPLNVGRMSKECQKNENSPTLSRSLSLDSISPTVGMPTISHQASSLSLNDVNELKEMESVGCGEGLLMPEEYKKFGESEAVIVEMEHHIMESASPLITVTSMDEKHMAICEDPNPSNIDFCFETHPNSGPLISALNRAEKMMEQLKTSLEAKAHEEFRNCEGALTFIRYIYPYYAENLIKPNVLNAVSDVQGELSRISELMEKSPLDEACCQEIMEDRILTYKDEIRGLFDALDSLKQNIQCGINQYSKDIVPDINITSAEAVCSGNELPDVASARIQSTQVETKAAEEIGESLVEDGKKDSSTNSAPIGSSIPRASSMNTGVKKKMRLRKMGSRQSSKTESDSSCEEGAQGTLETPRRLKRKNYRLKQRSFDEDFSSRKQSEEPDVIGEDVVYVLKVKPGHPIQQCENVVTDKTAANERNERTHPESPLEVCAVAMPLQMVSSVCPLTSTVNKNANIFVKTKRKVFTTVEEPNGIVVVEKVIQNSEQREVKAPKAQEKIVTQKAANVRSSVPSTKSPLKLFSLHKKFLSAENLSKVLPKEAGRERRGGSVDGNPTKPKKPGKAVRLPLASDSFRTHKHKHWSPIARELELSASASIKRLEHIFKKNPDKGNASGNSKCNGGATVKRIETNKLAKSPSSPGGAVDEKLLQPLTNSEGGVDKSANTLPRISRKLACKSVSPTTKLMVFDYPTPTTSEPTSPLFDTPSKPHTPITERALRLQRAKEEFLRSGSLPRDSHNVKRRDDIIRNHTWDNYRRSDHSLSSTSMAIDDGGIAKSLSVETMTAETPNQSDTGTDVDCSTYDSLPRIVSRSGKISSKLGFATLASKFRRVKGKKEPKKTSSGSALSTLCKQSLMADVIAVPQAIATGGSATTSTNIAEPRNQPTGECVKKSHSTPQATTGTVEGISQVRREIERLNKSQSEQYVKRLKESYV